MLQTNETIVEAVWTSPSDAVAAPTHLHNESHPIFELLL